MQIQRMAKAPTRTEQYAAIGRRLALLRLTRGYESQKEFADAFDFNYTQWNNYERGSSRPNPDDALRLKRRFGVTTDWIYDGDESHLSVEMLRRLEEASAKLAAQETATARRKRGRPRK